MRRLRRTSRMIMPRRPNVRSKISMTKATETEEDGG
jgi:hypothetical protein